MTDVTHTPAPWTADLGETFKVRTPDGGTVASLYWLTKRGRRSPTEVAANARLIAAAPELLDAAQEGLICAEADVEQRKWELRDRGDDFESDDELRVYRERVARIRAAIAKARGQS